MMTTITHPFGIVHTGHVSHYTTEHRKTRFRDAVPATAPDGRSQLPMPSNDRPDSDSSRPATRITRPARCRHFACR